MNSYKRKTLTLQVTGRRRTRSLLTLKLFELFHCLFQHLHNLQAGVVLYPVNHRVW